MEVQEDSMEVQEESVVGNRPRGLILVVFG